MKNIFATIVTVGLLVIVSFSSCQKVIDINLNSVSPKYVIEGEVTNAPGPYQVKITKTKNYNENNTFEGITDAFITVADNTGALDTLTQTSQGIYKTTHTTGMPGKTYYLTVKIEGETFAAQSTMPAQVNLDTAYVIDTALFIAGSPKRYITFIKYFDPTNTSNYYRYILYKNHVASQDLSISDDEFNNGKPVMQFFNYSGFNDTKIISGDSVTMEMQCIDASVHEYFRTLSLTIDQSSSAPANPTSNISGGCLGYFSAHTVQVKTVIVP